MNLSKIIGAVLIIISLLIGYVGVNKIANSSKQINLLGVIKIDASDESQKKEGYLYFFVAVLLFGGGVVVMNKSKN